MKFLCDQCKAKYQIADDKVAGKTVKMKCRKCGHLIEVRAAVTGTVETRESQAPNTSPMATSLSRVDNLRPPRDALGSAFTKSVKEDESVPPAGPPATRSIALSPGDEWYVAINGVPVGPVRVGEIRRKAATGAVTEDSLCWQEGFEEWRPVKAVPEIADMVREAAASGRASLVPPAPESRPPPGVRPPMMRPGSAPSLARAPSAATIAAPIAGLRGQGASFSDRPGATALPFDDDDATVVGRSSTAPLAAALAASGPPRPSPAAVSVAPDPFAVPALFPVPPASPAASAGHGALAAPAASTPALASRPDVAAASPRENAARQTTIPALNPAQLITLVVGVAFAITTAVVLFLRPAAPAAAPAASTSASAGSAAASSPATTAVATNDIPAPENVDTTAPADSNANANKGGKATGGTGAASPATGKSGPAASSGAAGVKAVDPSIAALLNGSGAGPSTGGGGGSSGGGSALTQDQIESVVRQRSTSVKRSCWEHSGTSAKSNNTTVALTIGGTGSVSSASASGNDPSISHCIENAVKSWQFPPSSGSTSVNIPFHFLSQ